MKNEEFVIDRLSNPDDLYLKNSKGKCKDLKEVKPEMTMDFLALYRIDEITFEDKAPRKEALENVISSMSIEGINFVYIILGDDHGVSFYYGVARDFASSKRDLEINDIGEMILKPSLQGNFRGSIISELNESERKTILDRLDKLNRINILEGVPGINKDDEKFQSVDRIIDVMLGDTFALMLIAQPLTGKKINCIQENMYELYNTISPISKNSVQQSSGKNSGASEAKTTGSSITESTNSSESTQSNEGTSTTHTKGKTIGTNKGTTSGTQTEKTSQSGTEGSHEDNSSSDADGTTTGSSKSKSTGDSKSETNSSSISITTQNGENEGTATTIEVVNRKVQDWIKYMDDVILPRLDYGMGKGLYITSTVLFGENIASLIKLENTIRSVYGGESGNRIPLKAFPLENEEIAQVRRFQVPSKVYDNEVDKDEISIRTACSQFFLSEKEVLLGNWMSSQEISLLAGVPQKEVVGLALREEVEFGLNINFAVKSPIFLGHLVQSGIVLNGDGGVSNIPIDYDAEYFDKHIFITGVTGSGKTTTCQKLLLASERNFLVIEPAKTEYRVMADEEFPDMLVFTLGKENGAPFRLNPFEFFEGENITSRVDMIKASMEAAFDMEAAIPQILETAIYECYKDKGWNIDTNKNKLSANPFADGEYSFPTLGEVDRKIRSVVIDQGFDEKLRDEYIGSIRARLKGLTVGSKGQMLNTPRSIDFVELLDKKVVLELEYIKSASEKSLIMGFILTNLLEAIRVKYNKNYNRPIKHLTLIEEAHRLLSKYMPGDSMNKKQGVEMFSDMIAEVRKYGESLIIADQIPDKLTPEVLKNTNTKIVHKIFAQDDKDAIGNTMALKDEQKEYLSYLTSGRAIMMHPGLSKAIQVQIKRGKENDTSRPPLGNETLRKKILTYYASIYKKGVLPGLEKFEEEPSTEMIEIFLEYLQNDSIFIKEYHNCIFKKKVSGEMVEEIRKLLKEFNIDVVVDIICDRCHNKQHLSEYPEIKTYVKEVLIKISEDGEKYVVKEYDNYRMLEGSLLKGEF